MGVKKKKKGSMPYSNPIIHFHVWQKPLTTPARTVTLGNIHTVGWRYREGTGDFGDVSGRPELILPNILCNTGCVVKCCLKAHGNPVLITQSRGLMYYLFRC